MAIHVTFLLQLQHTSYAVHNLQMAALLLKKIDIVHSDELNRFENSSFFKNNLLSVLNASLLHILTFSYICKSKLQLPSTCTEQCHIY